MNKHAIVACAAMALLALAALLAWQLGLEAPEVQANERGGEAVAVDPMAMDSRTTSEREPVAASNERSQATSKAGWWLVGSVTDAKDRPVAGARVLVSLRRGDVSQDVAEVRTDGTGRYEVDVAEARTLSPLQRRYASLVARATAKGYLPGGTARLRKLPAEDLETWQGELNLRLATGKVLSGLVLRGAGVPVPGAHVVFHARSAGHSVGSATTDSEGRYQVPINSSGAFWIVARELSYGIAFSPTIQLDPSRDTQAPDLVLRPEGVIAGAVVYADGTPCRDLRLTYWWSEALPPDPLVPQKWPAELVENKYIGHGLRTDKHGRFRIAGLRRGRYKITLKGGSKAEKTRYFATGTLDARIVIGLQRLRVRVMDGAGGPLCYSDVSWVVWSPDEAAEAERRFQDGEFMAEVLDSRQASGGSNTSGPRAEKEFLAAAGSFWLFQAVIPGCAPATAGIRVRSRPGEHETVIPLVLARCANTGTVRIELTDSAGSPIRKYRARLQHPVTGSGVAWLDRTYKEGPDIFDAVAPGRYRLEVKPGGSVTNLVPYFPIVREVRVTGGQESLVKLQPPAGGRVRITLRVSGEQPRRLTNFKLRAVFEGGRKRPILGPYVYKTKTGWEGGWRATPGESFLCRRLLEPGRHTLYFEADGHQPKQVVVKIEAGKTVDLEVWLIPR